MAAPPVASWGRGRQTDARIGIAGGSTRFGLDVRDWCDRNRDRAEQVVRAVAMAMFRNVVRMSPVDTGRFRGNWQTTIGTLPDRSLLRLDKTGELALAEAQKMVDSLRIGDKIYLTNNLVYARRLEYGWSKQAPAGMVGITVAEFQATIDRSVREATGGSSR